MSPRGRDDAQYVEVAGRRVRLTNLDRVLYPGTGFTKAEMIQYYSQVADVILPQLKDRPVTRIRFPDTVEDERFFEKNVPAGAPDWLRHRVLHANPDDEDATEVDFPFLDDLAGLVWAANAGAVELHTPQWRVGPRGKVHHPDRLVIDLDPGPPAGLDECARVAHLVADRLEEDGLVDTYPVTSGSKGMQLYAPLDGKRTATQVREYAREVAGALAAAHPKLVLANMKRDLRPGKVLLDWSQNHAAKTTVTPYSLRGRALPMVAAPRDWEEIEPGLRQLGPDEVVRRLEDDGDLLADLRRT
ncbi:non-homologous end-joining DNA ligase [Actinotalea sp. Marseille-Q4924]|uniref:non-homologous end-joining DNA ligase n=1 Tax=Actinotalea sp. Marseille-Q4924 TaxID=2866571 RepID=UPI001CE43F4D|nr:non-homologous end-joining DNA ligase [Actinotalea sp. Marseille-Q4924]